MATAALLKPPQKTLDALNAWIDKILNETISDTPLKATLIYEALQKYGVSAAVAAESRNIAPEVFAALLDARIDPSATVDFHGVPYKEIDRAKLERQLKAIKQATGIVYSGGMSDAWYTNDMAQKIAIRGVSDLMQFAAHHNEVTLPAGATVQRNDDTGQPVYYVTYGAQGWEEHYPVNPDNITTISGGYDGAVTYTLKTPMTLDLGVDYYYNKANGAKFPLSGDVWESAFEGSGGVYYHVKFTDTGLPIFWTQHISTNTFSDLAPIISIAVLAFTMGGGAAWLGGEILGAVGVTASPAVTAAVGNVAINTAATGGNVGLAVTSAAASLAGGSIGGQIGQSVDSVQIGKAAEIATSAALQGKNPSASSIALALASGVKMGEGDIVDTTSTDYAFTQSVGDTTAVGYDTGAFDLTLADIGISTDPVSLSDSLDINEVALSSNGIDIAAISSDAEGTMYDQAGDFVAMPESTYAQSFYVDAQGNVRTPENTIAVPAEQAATMTAEELAVAMNAEWANNTEKVVTSEAAPDSRPAALPPAAGQVKVPSIADQASTYDKLLKTAVSIGASIKAITSGTFRPSYSTSPYGTPRVQAVGVPVQRADGSIVTNNGNGTQTIRYPNGQVQTVPTTYNAGAMYGGGLLAGINTQTLMIGGGVLLVALLLAKRK